LLVLPVYSNIKEVNATPFNAPVIPLYREAV